MLQSRQSRVAAIAPISVRQGIDTSRDVPDIKAAEVHVK